MQCPPYILPLFYLSIYVTLFSPFFCSLPSDSPRLCSQLTREKTQSTIFHSRPLGSISSLRAGPSFLYPSLPPSLPSYLTNPPPTCRSSSLPLPLSLSGSFIFSLLHVPTISRIRFFFLHILLLLSFHLIPLLYLSYFACAISRICYFL